MSTTPIPQYYGPPQGIIPITDPSWTRWLIDVVWQTIGKGLDNSGPQGTFPQLQVGDCSFTTENAVQELLTIDQGLYSNYYSSVAGILYGFACNVHRSGGTSFVVAAQLNAWAEQGVTAEVFGVACTALSQPQSVNCTLVGMEPNIVNQDSSNTSVKWGINPVFKDRFDGVAATVSGLGSNLFNYGATGIAFTSQARSSSAEYCGWNVGIDFLDYWGDQDKPSAWSSSYTYTTGQTVTYGGYVWKSIAAVNLNQTPAGGSSYWVQRTYSGTNNLAVGIDFSSMSTGAMARMASAIRLRNTQLIHFEESGAVGIGFDAANSQLKFYNQASVRLAINVATGLLQLGTAAIAIGSTTTCTLGKTGGSGPATAAQAKWLTLADSGGNTYFIPAWQ